MIEKLKLMIEELDLLTGGHSVAVITIFAVIIIAFFMFIDYNIDNNG